MAAPAAAPGAVPRRLRGTGYGPTRTLQDNLRKRGGVAEPYFQAKAARKKEFRKNFPWLQHRNGDAWSETLENFYLDRTVEEEVFWETARANLRKEIPKNSISKEDWPKFEAALHKEWEQWLRLGAGTIIGPEEAKDVPEDCIIGSRPIFTDRAAKKRTPDNPVEIEAKVRLVVRGDQEKNKEDLRRDSPTGSLLGAHVVAQTSASQHWPLKSLDATNAYFQGEKLIRDLFTRPPKGFALPGVLAGSVIKAARSIYGAVDGARAWWSKVKGVFTSLGAMV